MLEMYPEETVMDGKVRSAWKMRTSHYPRGEGAAQVEY